MRHSIIGMVYDFDGTLSPNNMQEDTIFPAWGIDKNQLWEKARRLVAEQGYERTLAYLRLLIHDEPFRQKPLQRDDLVKLAANICYFEGVKDYFTRIDSFVHSIPEVEKWGIELEHYVVSSGMKEILEGTEIYPCFKKVYACEYEYDDKGPVFPKLVINDTNKTQFLFRINKGKLDLQEDVNSHMPEPERRIPFQNMIYIGDSETDIPSLAVVKRFGGQAVAVFNPARGISVDVSNLIEQRRVDHFAPADYRENSVLMEILRVTLRKVIYRMIYSGSVEMSREWIQKNRPPSGPENSPE